MFCHCRSQGASQNSKFLLKWLVFRVCKEILMVLGGSTVVLSMACVAEIVHKFLTHENATPVSNLVFGCIALCCRDTHKCGHFGRSMLVLESFPRCMLHIHNAMSTWFEILHAHVVCLPQGGTLPSQSWRRHTTSRWYWGGWRRSHRFLCSCKCHRNLATLMDGRRSCSFWQSYHNMSCPWWL